MTRTQELATLHPKATYTGAAGALATVIAWSLHTFLGVEPTPEVAVAFAGLALTAAAYLGPQRTAVDHATSIADAIAAAQLVRDDVAQAAIDLDTQQGSVVRFTGGTINIATTAEPLNPPFTGSMSEADVARIYDPDRVEGSLIADAAAQPSTEPEGLQVVPEPETPAPAPPAAPAA